MPKAKKSPGNRERHNPLTEDYAPSQPSKQKAGKQKKRTRNEDEEGFVDSKASKKILEIGRDLAEEDVRENQARRPPVANPAFDFDTRLGEDEEEEHTAQYDEDEAWGDEEEEVEEIGMHTPALNPANILWVGQD
jgi:essential nuclear protein 1